jgi:hexosaminidase
MAQLEYMTYPRAIALSTALWSETKLPYEQFLSTLRMFHFPFLSSQKVNFSRAALKPELKTSRGKNGGIEIQKVPPKGLDEQPEVLNIISPTKKKTKVIGLKIEQGSGIAPKQLEVIQHKALGAQIVYQTPPSPKYDNGSLTIVDGQLGARPWKGHEWLGFSADSVSFEIIFEKPVKIKEIRIHTLHDPNSWIWAAQTYNISFSKIGLANGIAGGYSTDETLVIENIKEKTQTIHVVLYGLGHIPTGNPGAGNVPWLFIDEIEVR